MEGSCWADQLSWVRRHSPLTARALRQFPDCSASELVICFHIDLKMIPVIEHLAGRVALKVVPCNQSTVDRQGWSYLRQFATVELLEPEQALDSLRLEPSRPRYLCDLGGELICGALQLPGSAVAALEGTSSGISRIERQLAASPPAFPILNWNSAPLKQGVHNEKMVGFSLWQTFTEITRLSLHGKTVGVLGFGAVGRGIARTARHLGGIVAVCDPLPAARILAAFEGFPTPPREVLLASDVVVTATGRAAALAGEDLELLRPGAFLLNAGHGCEELSEEIRQHPGRRQVLRHVEEIRYGSQGERHCFLLARGELVNLGAGFGDTINGFDLTAAQLAQALRYLLQESHALAAGWHSLPSDFINDVLV
jgi:adenosylhomocysteinase